MLRCEIFWQFGVGHEVEPQHFHVLAPVEASGHSSNLALAWPCFVYFTKYKNESSPSGSAFALYVQSAACGGRVRMTALGGKRTFGPCLPRGRTYDFLLSRPFETSRIPMVEKPIFCI